MISESAVYCCRLDIDHEDQTAHAAIILSYLVHIVDTAQACGPRPSQLSTGCSHWPSCGAGDEWTSPYSFVTGTPVSLYVRRTVGGLTTTFYPTRIEPATNSARFWFDLEGTSTNLLVNLTPVTPTCPFPTVTMLSPEDGAYYFTGPCNDYTLPEEERHTPTSGDCVPAISWKEDLMDQGGGTWHAAQDIHTATLIPQSYGVSSRTLVVQVKAENQQGGAAVDRATMTLYKAQDRPIQEYRELIDEAATAAANDVGVDPEMFKTYMKAQLCVESGWQGYKLGYCSPTVGPNKNKQGQIVSRDWGIAQVNDKAFKADKVLFDPRGGVLFGPIDESRRKFDPFYGIRFQAKLLSRFILKMNRSRRFRELTLEEKFENAMVMYNAGEDDFIWSIDQETGEHDNPHLLYLIENNVGVAIKIGNYLNAIIEKVRNPCH